MSDEVRNAVGAALAAVVATEAVARYIADDAGFKEEEHPRDDSGKFSAAGGGPAGTERKHILGEEPDVSYTKEEAQFIEEYKAAASINDALREGHYTDGSDVLDEIFEDKAFVLKESAKLYRGADLPDSVADQLTPGVRFRDKAFLSTSADESVAKGFVKGKGVLHLFRITALPGTKYLPLGGEEKEILLDRSVAIRIDSVSTESGVRIVSCHIGKAPDEAKH